jgi:ketosteroid isomerase-like protein
MSQLRKKAPYRAAFAAMIVGLLVACSGPTAPVVPVADPNAAQTTLDAALQADRDFAAAVAKDGAKAAFAAWFHPTDSQFVQPGVYLKGAEAIAAPFEQSPPGFSIGWTPDSGVASASGDFATTTGRYAVKMGDQTLEQGRYDLLAQGRSGRVEGRDGRHHRRSSLRRQRHSARSGRPSGLNDVFSFRLRPVRVRDRQTSR